MSVLSFCASLYALPRQRPHDTPLFLLSLSIYNYIYIESFTYRSLLRGLEKLVVEGLSALAGP